MTGVIAALTETTLTIEGVTVTYSPSLAHFVAECWRDKRAVEVVVRDGRAMYVGLRA